MEKVVSFNNKANQKLFGILHVPDNEAGLETRIGINLLNPGLKNRVAPNRLNVKIARKLCEIGFYVLRFDPFGIGDSEGELSCSNEPIMDLWGAIQRGIFVEDTITANSYFISEAKLDKLILIGQCGGGVTAGLTGAGDNRVDGLILIDTPFRIVSSKIDVTDAVMESYTPNQLMEEYIRDFLKFNWLQRLLPTRTNLLWLRDKLGIIGKLYRTRNDNDEENTISERFNYKLAKSLMKFMERGNNICYLFAENDFSLREFNSDFRNNFLENNLNCEKRFSIDIIKNANHIYTESEWQHALFGNIIDWLLFRGSPSAPRRENGAVEQRTLDSPSAPLRENQEFETDAPPGHCSTAPLWTTAQK